MAAADLRDYQWLVSEAADAYLRQGARDAAATVALVAQLRQELSPSRAHLVMDQIELRHRAGQKFQAAEQMFFTRKLLEQATDEATARYKAGRYPAGSSIIDLCCGLGGDLLALAGRGKAVGFDIDPVATLLAATNCERLAAGRGSARVGDARSVALDPGTLWHIDPDRRAGGPRSTQLQYWQPDGDALNRLIARHPDGAMKLAPATDLPAEIAVHAEREWIGQPRTCRQQVAWLGRLARSPGAHTATVLGRGPAGSTASITGQPDQGVDVAATVGRYLHEPQAAILASRLTGALAASLELAAIVPGVAYLTSDHRIDADPRVATFEVASVMPFDLKRLKAELRRRKIGRLEIKHRGLQLDPERLRKRLRVPGDAAACLLIAGTRPGGTVAILAHRVFPRSAD